MNGNTNISVNDESTLRFENQAAQGQNSATAISNGDSLSHSLIVNGGTVTRSNVCELFVCMGLDVEDGEIEVANPGGQNSGAPLHFTGTNPDGTGMDVNGGLVSIYGDMTVDAGAIMSFGTVQVHAWDNGSATLTLGVNANSPWSELVGNGELDLQGKLIAHGGGFYMDGGNLNTATASFADIVLDTGATFEMYSGEIDLTDPGGKSANGYFLLEGNFLTAGGDIVDNVNSTQGQESGFFGVTGNATLSPDTIFYSTDLNPNANANENWRLMAVSGTREGDFTYSLPPTWTANWDGVSLYLHEPNTPN